MSAVYEQSSNRLVQQTTTWWLMRKAALSISSHLTNYRSVVLSREGRGSEDTETKFDSQQDERRARVLTNE